MATTAPVATGEERRLAAIEACRLAYAPLPPTTPGAPLLCWRGRLQKAVQLGYEATLAGNHERSLQIRRAIETLNEAANAAHARAQQACAHYHGMCASLGRKPDEVMPPKCECEGCQLGNLQTTYFEAEHDYRKALFDLIMPDDATGKLPLLVQLVAQHETEVLMRMLTAIAEAAKAYRAASLAYGVNVDYGQWHKVLK